MINKGSIITRLNRIDNKLIASEDKQINEVIIKITDEGADYYILTADKQQIKVDSIDKYITNKQGKLIQPIKVNVSIEQEVF